MRIPVWRTIGHAYAFAFANLATLVGIVWLPLGLLLGAEYFTVRRYLDVSLTAAASGDRFSIYGASGYVYLVWAIAILLQAIIAVPIMRQALGLRDRGAFVHLALGPAELRMCGAFIAYNVILVTILFLGRAAWTALSEGASYAADNYGAGYGVSSSDVALWSTRILQWGLAAASALLYVRLWFFLAPIVVAENRIDLVHSWTLTRGSFFRLLFIVACVGLPVWLLYICVQLGFVGFATFGDALSVLTMAGRVAGPTQAAAGKIQVLLSWLPYLFGAWFLIQPLALGLLAGASAGAYRALVPDAAAVSSPPADGPLPAAVS